MYKLSFPGMQAPFELAQQMLEERRIQESLHLLDHAESCGHDPDECASARWSCWMLSGRFDRAWAESDRIAARGGPDPNRFWDGQPFTGKRVIIRCLHGFGDTIQFIRYARLVRQDASRVIAQVHPELVNVIRCVPGVDQVISWSDEVPSSWDQQIEVMELPRAFRTTEATIPASLPYICPTPDLRARSLVAPWPGSRPRIGLQWGSSVWNPARSMHLLDLRSVLEVDDFDYYSFQRGEHRRQLAELQSPYIADVSGDCPDIAAAAADLLRIDLLITVDTMLAHLAGALGRSVWVLLPWDSDWRWMLHRTDSPWYPGMRLFRQKTPGDWSAPVHDIAMALAGHPLRRREDLCPVRG